MNLHLVVFEVKLVNGGLSVTVRSRQHKFSRCNRQSAIVLYSRCRSATTLLDADGGAIKPDKILQQYGLHGLTLLLLYRHAASSFSSLYSFRLPSPCHNTSAAEFMEIIS